MGSGQIGHPNNSAAKAGASSVGGDNPGHPNNSAHEDAANKANPTVSKQGDTSIPATYASKVSENKIDPSRDPRLANTVNKEGENRKNMKRIASSPT